MRTTDPGGRFRRTTGWLALVALLAAACQSASSSESTTTGGETHFLTCETDLDCESSSGYRCVEGECQVAVSMRRADAAPPPPVDAGDECLRGSVAADEVVIVGDSFFATTHEITDELETLARDAGVRSNDEQYRDYSRLVSNALAHMGNGLEAQYSEAAAEGPIRVVIMNGGGADALLGTCDTVDAECPMITDAADAARNLLEKMATDGVTDVIYVFYPDAESAPTREKVDALRPLIQRVCDEASTQCRWLDLRPTFEGNYDEYISDDGLNPTTSGSKAVAREIWAIMQSNCIAQ